MKKIFRAKIVEFEKDRELALIKSIKEKFEILIFDDGLQDNKIRYVLV